MIDITLRGILGKKFGPEWRLEVESVYEIFNAIEANTHRTSSCFTNVVEFVSHFIVLINGKIMPGHLLNSKILKSGNKVEILPVIQGGFIGAIIIGIVLIVAAILIAKFLSPKAPEDVATNSTILGGIRNVLNRNIVIPVGYGRLRIGSAVIANNTSVNYINYDADLKNLYRKI